MINLLLLSNFYPVISYRRVRKESDAVLYTVWSLVMVRNHLPARAVNKRNDEFFFFFFIHRLTRAVASRFHRGTKINHYSVSSLWIQWSRNASDDWHQRPSPRGFVENVGVRADFQKPTEEWGLVRIRRRLIVQPNRAISWNRLLASHDRWRRFARGVVSRALFEHAWHYKTCLL